MKELKIFHPEDSTNESCGVRLDTTLYFLIKVLDLETDPDDNSFAQTLTTEAEDSSLAHTLVAVSPPFFFFICFELSFFFFTGMFLLLYG
jgi:hypothetical protein